jgi:hypothetical protein
MGTRTALKAYIYLILLTIISVLLGEAESSLTQDRQNIVLGGILVLSTFKGIQIIDVFMELKHAPKLWRKVLLSYVILVPTIIAMIYLIF